VQASLSHALDTELAYFAAHRSHLLDKHDGQWVLIQGHRLLGYYDSQIDAINSGYQRLGNVPFLARRVEAKDSFCEFASLSVER
jgi:hypothetical protein